MSARKRSPGFAVERVTGAKMERAVDVIHNLKHTRPARICKDAMSSGASELRPGRQRSLPPCRSGRIADE
jgi:hypothetical protein